MGSCFSKPPSTKKGKCLKNEKPAKPAWVHIDPNLTAADFKKAEKAMKAQGKRSNRGSVSDGGYQRVVLEGEFHANRRERANNFSSEGSVGHGRTWEEIGDWVCDDHMYRDKAAPKAAPKATAKPDPKGKGKAIAQGKTHSRAGSEAGARSKAAVKPTAKPSRYARLNDMPFA